MILVDPRSGSQNYIPRLRALGAAVEVVEMEFGDIAFYGAGGHIVGVELKTLNDLLACITTGRFAGHQLPGLARDYTDAWLIVEGLWRPNPEDGALETRRHGEWTPIKLGPRTWMHRQLEHFLTTIEIKGGVRIKRTGSQDETARAVHALYQWYQNYDSHKSHLALNRAHVAAFVAPTFVRRVAAELPGVGYERSGMIAGHFGTVRKMIDATVREWTTLPGIGKKLAKGIVESWDSAA